MSAAADLHRDRDYRNDTDSMRNSVAMRYVQNVFSEIRPINENSGDHVLEIWVLLSGNDRVRIQDNVVPCSCHCFS